MSDQTPNVSGSQGPNFIPPPQNTEAQYVKGQIPSPGDTIAPASTSYQCVSVPTGLSPLPTLNPSDDTLTIFQRQKKLEEAIKNLASSSTTPAQGSQTISPATQAAALSAFLSVSGAINQSALQISNAQSILNQQASKLTTDQLAQAQNSLTQIQNLNQTSDQLQSQIAELETALKNAQTTNSASQQDISNLKIQLSQTLNQVSQLNSSITPPITPLPTDVHSLQNWLVEATNGSHRYNGSPISSSTTPFSNIQMHVGQFNKDQQTINDTNIIIQSNQQQITLLNSQQAANQQKLNVALNTFMSAVNMPKVDLNDTSGVSKQVLEAYKLATKIMTNVSKTDEKSAEDRLNALKFLLTIQGEMNVRAQQTENDMAQQAHYVSTLNLQEAQIAFSLSSKIAVVAHQISADQGTVADLNEKIHKLSIAEDVLTGALVLASIGCIFGVGCAAAATIGVALGALEIASGAYQCQLSTVESKIGKEQQQEAGLQRQFDIANAAASQLSTVANTFVDLVGEIVKQMQANTKTMSQGIEAATQASVKLSSHA